jgi:hypothetical protein
MPDESTRRYLFVGIDRASRWVYLAIMPDKSASSAARFLNKLKKAAPFRISKVLTDNGKEFTDRFDVNSERTPTGNHLFDVAWRTTSSIDSSSRGIHRLMAWSSDSMVVSKRC